MPIFQHEPPFAISGAPTTTSTFTSTSTSLSMSTGSSMLLSLLPRYLSHEVGPSTNASTSARRGLLDRSLDTTDLLTHDQRISVQAVACALAGLSLCSVLVTLYWFSLMRKKFRHRLIMMLIIADFIRSLWLFIFPAVSLAHGQVTSGSAFCQVSGYFTLTGTEMADFSTLSIAVHTAMQILRPTLDVQRAKETGLNKYQRFVFSATVLVPLALAALPFIRSSHGYLSQGAFCTLPLRPFWYRLAISWIPRYIILLSILGLYVAIYIYVWRHFRRSPALRTSSGRQRYFETSAATDSQLDGPLDFGSRSGGAALLGQGKDVFGLPQLDPAAIMSWREALESRRGSDGTTLVDPGSSTHTPVDGARSKRQSLYRQSHEFGDAPRVYDGLFESVLMPKPKNLPKLTTDLNARVKHDPESQSQRGIKERTMSHDLQRNSIENRYKAVKRQLNLLFVYPVCYFFIWLIPLGFNICNYNRYLVQHPVFVVVLLTYACNSSMGFVDCMIFCIRERPWRHIPGSDGTFFGSFLFWKHSKVDNQYWSNDGSTLRTWSKRPSIVNSHMNAGWPKKRQSTLTSPAGASSPFRKESAVSPASTRSTPTATKTNSRTDEESGLEKGGGQMSDEASRRTEAVGRSRRELYWFERVTTNDTIGGRS